ncbi:amidohydrolase [Streptomyces sp. MST-110588]|nr:amidohydrolase [Streptomyces sp. MST-110588]
MELVDQHSLGAFHGELGLGSFESHLAAAGGARGPAPYGTSAFDTWTGLGVRRWCPPLLGLEPHCPPARYLARRRELGAYRAGRLLLRGAGIGTFLLETGAQGGPAPGAGPTMADGPAVAAAADPVAHLSSSPELTTASELAAAAEGRVHEVVRLESLAEQAADTAASVDAFLGHLAEDLYAAAQYATAFAVGVTYCDGLAPGAGEVRRAAGRWLGARRPGRRLGEPVLLRHLLWNAVGTGLPVQLHCRDPRPLARFLAATAGLGTDLVLLPGEPHHVRAAHLAAVHPHVYADAGPRPEETLARAPFGKLLFSTGARGLPELYVTGARFFLRAVRQVVGEWAEEGMCGRADARRITAMIASGTARRIYRLEAEVPAAG